jgi:hypothetical protein
MVGSKRRAPRSLGDVAIVCGKDERGLHILRRRFEDGPIEAAVAQPLAEGRPITGEVISMRQREDLPFLFDVTSEIDASGNPTAGTGSSATGSSATGSSATGSSATDSSTSRSPRPAKVATNSYRRGWDAIWGSRGARGPVN